MSRRRKLKKVSVADIKIDSAPLDLRPNTILNRGADVIGFEIESATTPGEKVVMWRSRKDPLYTMYAEGTIDEPQLRAGERWRECYGLCEIGAVRGQDPTKEYVDTSPSTQYEPTSDRAIKAGKDLKKARVALGVVGEWIVRKILGEGLFPGRVAELLGYKSERATSFYAQRFREALQTLAVTFTNCS